MASALETSRRTTGSFFLASSFILASIFGKSFSEIAVTLRRHHIVEETCLNSGTEAELDAGIEFLQSLGKQVGRSVPEGVLTLVVVELIKFDGGIVALMGRLSSVVSPLIPQDTTSRARAGEMLSAI
jgi:hypothetical protein